MGTGTTGLMTLTRLQFPGGSESRQPKRPQRIRRPPSSVAGVMAVWFMLLTLLPREISLKDILNWLLKSRARSSSSSAR
ncbi:MAG: hypothetical protein BWY13_00896 [Euryarchaeota archaeon ADurb.Bin190]|nr:MAG: hypothetical protein BWY13_00896 [Euryarchaeota archaeon ADurb.Bin190]